METGLARMVSLAKSSGGPGHLSDADIRIQKVRL